MNDRADRSEPLGFVQEFRIFLRYHWGWWLTPILVVLLGLLVVALIGSGGESGFTYDLF